mmetsp:Transcript_10176/g.20727  ORF Transcript_10176/g.20727 Transcript_10176/m.20727 type:complete len:111 (-) Transcript_10176:561-893(-)
MPRVSSVIERTAFLSAQVFIPLRRGLESALMDGINMSWYREWAFRSRSFSAASSIRAASSSVNKQAMEASSDSVVCDIATETADEGALFAELRIEVHPLPDMESISPLCM